MKILFLLTLAVTSYSFARESTHVRTECLPLYNELWLVRKPLDHANQMPKLVGDKDTSLARACAMIGSQSGELDTAREAMTFGRNEESQCLSFRGSEGSSLKLENLKKKVDDEDEFWAGKMRACERLDASDSKGLADLKKLVASHDSGWKQMNLAIESIFGSMYVTDSEKPATADPKISDQMSKTVRENADSVQKNSGAASGTAK